jgi:cell division septation protein DedD
MKRIFIATLLFCSFAINASPIINRINQDSGDNKNQFFPMSVGQVREFSKEENGTTATCTWKVDGVFDVTDEQNKLKNQKAYQFVDSSNGDIFYFTNFDGFVCKYAKAEDGTYKLTRMLPENIVEDYNWISNNITFIITDVSIDYVTVEFFDNQKDVSGYNKFKKASGPCEIYVNDATATQKHDMLAKLTKMTQDEKVSQQALPTEKEVESVVKNPSIRENSPVVKEDVVVVEEPAKKGVTETAAAKPATSTANQVIMINAMQKNLYYIQIGSFAKKENAFNICVELRQKGFQSVVFEDKDGVFKVLVEGNSNMDEILAQLRTQVTSGAFVKKRIGK